MRINRLLRQGLTVLLSLSMSLGPCTPGRFVTYAESMTESCDSETNIEEEPASDSEETSDTEEVSDTEEGEEGENISEEASGDSVSDDDPAEEEPASETDGEIDEGTSLDQVDEEEREEDPGDKTEEEQEETDPEDDDTDERIEEDPEPEELSDTHEESETADGEISAEDNDSIEESVSSAGNDAINDGISDEVNNEINDQEEAGETSKEEIEETEATEEADTSAESTSSEDGTETVPAGTETEPAGTETVVETEEDEDEEGSVVEVTWHTLQTDVDDTTVTVIYKAGAFPENAALEVENISEDMADQNETILKAFEITILDAAGNEAEPDTEAGELYIRFSGITGTDEADIFSDPENIHVFGRENTETDDLTELKKTAEPENFPITADGEVINDKEGDNSSRPILIKWDGSSVILFARSTVTVEEPVPAEPEKTELHTVDPQTYFVDLSDMVAEEYTDNERLLGYLKKYQEHGDLLTGALLEAPRNPRYNKLSESEKKIYNKLLNMGAEISAGNRASTVCTITAGELGRAGTYDVKDYETGADGQQMTQDDIVWAVLGVDGYNIATALASDAIYELYWADYGMTYISPLYEYDGEQIIISSDAVLEFDLLPNQFYAAGEFSVNTNLTKKAAKAAGTANNIVQQAAGKTDYEKVVFYKNRIRQLSGYNYDAAANSTSTADNNPWRMIYVFDGDPSTKVVCEGYAQAFKYLCDITDFRSSNVECRIAYGTLYGNYTGGHAWNILTMDDGKNYMADVTNCENGSVFLNGYLSGDPEDGYWFRSRLSSWKYVYYPKHKTGVLTGMELFSDDELVLSSTDYAPVSFIPVTGISLTKTGISLTEGEKSRVSAVVVPSNATDRNVDWGSSNTAVAEVDREGIIIGKKAGTAVISGVTVNGKFKASCTVTVVSSTKLETFVKRLYTTCLGRAADNGGLKYWCGRIRSGSLKGIGLAGAFVFSSEFTSKNYCDRHFVKQLYPALMGREADRAGLNYWAGRLGTGTKREQLLNEFTSCAEYKRLCTEAGIEPGAKISVPEYGVQPYGACAVCGEKTKVVQFVERAYRECMGRAADAGGLKYWSKSLYEHTSTGKTLVMNFVLSSEMRKKNLNNKEYIKAVYRVMLGREADNGGLKYWHSQMESGKTIEDIINGFADSDEFKGICSDYGIQRK